MWIVSTIRNLLVPANRLRQAAAACCNRSGKQSRAETLQLQNRYIIGSSGCGYNISSIWNIKRVSKNSSVTFFIIHIHLPTLPHLPLSYLIAQYFTNLCISIIYWIQFHTTCILYIRIYKYTHTRKIIYIYDRIIALHHPSFQSLLLDPPSISAKRSCPHPVVQGALTNKWPQQPKRVLKSSVNGSAAAISPRILKKGPSSNSTDSRWPTPFDDLNWSVETVESLCQDSPHAVANLARAEHHLALLQHCILVAQAWLHFIKG